MEQSDLAKIKVIGFDLDNTLYPTNSEMQSRIRRKIYEKLSSKLNISIESAEEQFEENYNGNFQWSHSGSRTINELAKRHQKTLDGSGIVQQSLEETDVLDFIQPNPKLQDILNDLFARNFYLDLITSSSYDLTFQKLRKIGINSPLFGFIFTGKEFGSKTDGTIFNYWLTKYFQKDIHPDQFLYIGDSKKQDIDSTKRLGIKTCIVGKQYENADLYIPTINDLESLFLSQTL